MKKNILIAIPSALLIAIIAIYIFVPSILPIWFIVRHIIMYLLFTYLTVFGTILIYRFLLTKVQTPTRLWLVRGLIVISGGIILFGGSEIQLYLVDTYEIPPVMGCVYYDKYDNLIYNSQYRGTCPELENLIYTTINPESAPDTTMETLSFEVREELINKEAKNYFITEIEIVYEPSDNLGVSSPELKLIQMIKIDSKEYIHPFVKEFTKSSTCNRYLKIVENEFGELLSESGEITESMMRSTITEYSDSFRYYVRLDEIIGWAGPITETEPTITIQEAKYTTIAGEFIQKRNYYDIEMTEKKIQNGIESDSKIFAEGNRLNTRNYVNLILDEATYLAIEYKASYGEEYLGGTSERYNILSYAVYPSKDVEVGYHYYSNSYQDNELKYLDYYTKTDGKYENTEDVSIKKYEQGESTYLLVGNMSVEVNLKEYGKKLTYYSTNRTGNGKYTILPESNSELTEDEIKYSDFMPLKMFYDSKALLFDIYTYKPLYMIPQRNMLFSGVPSMVLVFT